MADIATVVLGETGVNLFIIFEDEDEAPIDITGGAVRLQGISNDITKELDVAGVVSDGPQGEAKWAEIGGSAYLVLADLGSLKEATYTFEGKLTDFAGKVRYSKPRFTVQFVKSLLDED